MENNIETNEALLTAENETAETAEAVETVDTVDTVETIETVETAEAPAEEPGSGKMPKGQLVWCIINVFIGHALLAGMALLFAFNAKKSPTAAGERKNIRIARIFNIISTAVGVILIAYAFISNM